MSALLVLATGAPSEGLAGHGARRMKYGTVNGGPILRAREARARARRLVTRQLRRLRDGGRVHVRLKIFRRYTFWGDATEYTTATNGSGTACGVPFRDDRLTAAHRTLPCGSRVLVENPANGRSVQVTITDRGPFGDEGRVLDLSQRAWNRLTEAPPGAMHVHAIVLERG